MRRILWAIIVILAWAPRDRGILPDWRTFRKRRTGPRAARSLSMLFTRVLLQSQVAENDYISAVSKCTKKLMASVLT